MLRFSDKIIPRHIKDRFAAHGWVAARWLRSTDLDQGWGTCGPREHWNIGCGLHQNFRYPIKSTTSLQNEPLW